MNDFQIPGRLVKPVLACRMQITEAAMIDLEMKVAHHEFAIENLQQAVLDQSTMIHRLETQLKEIQERFEGATNDAQDIGPHNVKPPHY